jgi:hypothetical protein
LPNQVSVFAWYAPESQHIDKIDFFKERKGDFRGSAGIHLIAGFAKFLSETGANKLLAGKQPIVPQERISLEDIVRHFYS